MIKWLKNLFTRNKEIKNILESLTPSELHDIIKESVNK